MHGLSRARALVLGNTTVDHVFRVAGGLAPDAKVQSERYDVYAGGQGANVASTLSLLDLDVMFAGAFGDDVGARVSREAFATTGVDLGLATTVSDCRHHAACILVAGCNRTIVMYRDPRLSMDHFAISAAAVAGCAVVYTDGHEAAASLHLARLAAETGTPLAMDIEVLTQQTMVLATFAGHLIAPLEIVRRLAQREDPAEAVRVLSGKGPVSVVATMGARGSVGVAVGDDAVVHMPAAPCTVVDTTGAGDAFHAGYVSALLRGEPLHERMRFAAAVAAAKCEVAGPRLTSEAFARRGLLSW
ncbi:carbohydrate kinase family protein [Dokdonella soli]|uniref:Sugar kinase n=1 Tax=Dokdonella soli TaxID=529810 RepID=A0ABN1IHN3_9GAMM